MQTKFFEMPQEDHKTEKGTLAEVDGRKELQTMPKAKDQWGARMGALKELLGHHAQDANGILKWSLTWPHKNSVGRR